MLLFPYYVRIPERKVLSACEQYEIFLFSICEEICQIEIFVEQIWPILCLEKKTRKMSESTVFFWSFKNSLWVQFKVLEGVKLERTLYCSVQWILAISSFFSLIRLVFILKEKFFLPTLRSFDSDTCTNCDVWKLWSAHKESSDFALWDVY